MLTSKLSKAFQSFRKPSRSFPYLPKTPKASRSFQSIHWTKALQSLTEAAKASQNFPKHPKTYKSLPNPSHAFQSLSRPSKAFRSIPKPSKASQNLPKPFHASQSLPKPCKVARSKDKWKVNGKTRDFCDIGAFLNERTRYSHQWCSANPIKMH